MDVVGHQYVGMNCAATIASRLFQPMEIAVAIFIGEKTRLAIDAALNNVQRVISKTDSGATGHIQWFRKLNVSDPNGTMYRLINY